MSSRVPSHIIEEQAKDRIRSIINADGNAIFRELTGRDYGVDAIIELFDDGIPTGKIAFVQIKGTSFPISPLLRTPNFVSCRNISISNLNYSFQNNIPVILLYTSLKGEKGFYYTVLNNNKDNDINSKLNQDTITIKIPINNFIFDDINQLFNIINSFYE